MSVLVTSCGRSGTNLVTEILTQSKELEATKIVEDKDIFRRRKIIGEKYLSKSDTHYSRNLDDIDFVMSNNPHLKIVWTIRDPKDMILSKMRRGQKGMDGNHITADDATPKGCVEDINNMFKVYNHIKTNYPYRIKVVKMEDVILDFENIIQGLCEYIGISYDENMKNFTFRNQHKYSRYKGLDSSQVGLWEKRNEVYYGFFSKNDYHIEEIANNINEITKYFEYETFSNSKG